MGLVKPTPPQASDSTECCKNMDEKDGLQVIDSGLECNFFCRKVFSIITHSKSIFFQNSCVTRCQFEFMCVSVLLCLSLLYMTEESPRWLCFWLSFSFLVLYSQLLSLPSALKNDQFLLERNSDFHFKIFFLRVDLESKLEYRQKILLRLTTQLFILFVW